MGNKDKYDEKLENTDELERIYQIYLRVQSGEKAALNELFKEKNTDNRQIYKADERYKERRLSNMDNVLDVEFVLENERENEKNKQIDKWINSQDSRVMFKFTCLNKLLYKNKKKLLSIEKDTGYENGKKKENDNHRKFYEGEYDLSDFDSLVYHTIIEIFNAKTDEDNYLTLDGKKNERYPICNGVNLLKNISYFTSRKINKRAEKSRFDVFDMGFYSEGSDKVCTYFDKKALEEFWKSESGTSRLSIYAEHLEWLKRNDVHKLFKTNACDIHAIIETIMNCRETFLEYDADVDIDSGFDMRLVTQEKLQKTIKFRHNLNIEQGNISKDLEIIEQRMLDHLFYSLNYRIDKAKESKGIYEKESERFLYELEKKQCVKIFGRASYEIYDKSIDFINSDINSNDFDSYFRTIKKYEDMVIDIVSLEKGKKKYDMVNLILENDDLVDDEMEALLNIAKILIEYYRDQEEKYRKNELIDYKSGKLVDWEKGFWEAELEGEILKIKLRSNRNVKKPRWCSINKEKLMVYCGYINFYFCDVEGKICYVVPKDRRIISRTNRDHEISIYNVG